MVWLTRTQFIIVALMIIGGAIYLMADYRRTMFVENSQDYALIVFDRPLDPTPNTKNVYLRVERNGEVITDGALLYEADFFDSEFAEMYPKPVWSSPSVLALDGKTNEDTSMLSLENKRSTTVDYVLVETTQNKFIVVGLAPGKQLNLKMNYDDLLSVNDAKFKGRIATPIRKEDRKNHQFEAIIDDDGIKISQRNVDPVIDPN